MADEVYTSTGSEVNKRKYEESPSPVARRATGFSSAPDSGAPPPSYSSVPPPMNEIELAKQKAQEIAARLLSNADPSKRARVENGGNGVGGYDSSDYEKPLGSGYSGASHVVSSGYGPSKKIEIPNGRVGVIIGKGGETIKYLQQQSGAKIQVTRDMDADPTSGTREVDLTGTPDQIAQAERLIHDVLAEAEAGGSGSVSRRVTGQTPGADQFVMKIPNNRVGLVIGKGGETIKSMQARTGARIQVIPLHLPPGDTSQERTVQIDGSSEQIEAAKQLVEEVISENRMRNPSMSGGYPQQGGYQTRPPSNWSQPSPTMQQPGYGYTQPGAYPGQPPQYNTNQPAYSGYPPQTASGGYAAGWDQSSAAAQQGGGYGYYNQGQGYTQDGYGGYYAGAAQSGYTQPQQNPTAGYNQQQQQGYNSTYGTAPNPTSETAAASYGTPGESHQAPIPNPGYPPQASNQPGYGAQTTPGYGPPQAQKPPTGPPAYAQPQQSPGAQGGGGYAQAGYPPSAQGGYAQGGYPAAQGGYGYGAPPPAAQPGYGQQQAASYNTAYGGATNAQGSYDAAAPPQSGKPEASPPS